MATRASPLRRSRLVAFHDHEPAVESFRDAVIDGLSQPQKTLPCKFFYDARGARLFERICRLPEYYPTRTEMGILRAHAADMAACIGPAAVLVELGSGSLDKVRILLDALERPAGYIPVDISREHLLGEAEALAADRPELAVAAVCADFTRHYDLPDIGGRRRVGFFPGSTIGNFEPPEAERLLASSAEALAGGGLLIGIDLEKDPDTLVAAYDDPQGVTAEFNLNLLRRINRELGATFDLEGFRHRALYNPGPARIEMHLVSCREQTARVGDRVFRFAAGETVHTENSHKFTIDGFHDLAQRAGFRPGPAWTDADALFAVLFLEAPG